MGEMCREEEIVASANRRVHKRLNLILALYLARQAYHIELESEQYEDEDDIPWDEPFQNLPPGQHYSEDGSPLPREEKKLTKA
ncbi:hypothetical protein MNV49_005311 [Pseudohyphozyma bogoriensis]|nr:hypothetical protein MNV49_005311 [Pseudohyphozyma bogoriensis]